MLLDAILFHVSVSGSGTTWYRKSKFASIWIHICKFGIFFFLKLITKQKGWKCLKNLKAFNFYPKYLNQKCFHNFKIEMNFQVGICKLQFKAKNVSRIEKLPFLIFWKNMKPSRSLCRRTRKVTVLLCKIYESTHVLSRLGPMQKLGMGQSFYNVSKQKVLGYTRLQFKVMYPNYYKLTYSGIINCRNF